ncbi:MAG: hypothetical protein OXC30_05585 [Alphaproteobacteria bacterium]|nr:hypothetical protein [Alphaproteobacteria bacterium]
MFILLLLFLSTYSCYSASSENCQECHYLDCPNLNLTKVNRDSLSKELDERAFTLCRNKLDEAVIDYIVILLNKCAKGLETVHHQRITGNEVAEMGRMRPVIGSCEQLEGTIPSRTEFYQDEKDNIYIQHSRVLKDHTVLSVAKFSA